MHTRAQEIRAELGSGIPDRSLEQRREALGRANAFRSARAELKRRMKAADDEGLAFALDVLATPAAVAVEVGGPPDALASMKVAVLLEAVPRLGHVRVNRILYRLRVSPSKTLAGLSARQRAELVEELHTIADVRGWPVLRQLPTERTAA